MQQNQEESVQDTTIDGFKAFSGSGDAAKSSLNHLTKLKGIGPATASLFLSTYAPDTAPFFSDELFRWCFFEKGAGKGWDRDIKYNVKEYLALFEKVQEFKGRFRNEHHREITAVDIEKVAYVLGKRSTRAKAKDVRPAKGVAQNLKRKAPVVDAAQESPNVPSTHTSESELANTRPSKRTNRSRREK